MAELVKGVMVRKAGTAIEQVRLRNMNCDLLASWDGTEVVRQSIAQGTRFGLRPQEGWSALECYYILEGQAAVENGAEPLILTPGDTLTGTPVKEACILQALTDMVVLYIGSRPSFHAVSGQMQNLQDLAVSVETKDGYTADHCRRIQELSVAMGKRLRLSSDQQYNLFFGSFLHDLGKVGIPDSILLKPGSLTPQEWDVMKRHPGIGREMLEETVAAGAAQVVEQHHERLDGSGYPLGLSGDAICAEAQVVAVVDSYDAMTTDRVYRPALPREAAFAELQKGAGRLYDPEIVKAFLDSVD